MAARCLELYKGDTLLYVGEGRRGANATDTFFDILEREWHCERVLALDPFPGNHERLFVMRRRK